MIGVPKMSHGKVNLSERYIFILNTEHVIMTNTTCSVCFNKKYNYVVSRFIPISHNEMKEWETIISTYLPIKCECKG